MTRNSPDAVVVGAGPAGLAAAATMTRLGMSVVLLDENRAAGGRIWQALETRDASDDPEGLALIRADHGERFFGASVWGIEDGTVFFSVDGTARSLRPRRIVLATGTTERPVPVPGWTLPGVMTVGAAQIALKTGGLVPDERTWIAGQGPLIYLYAAQALRAGGRIGGILELGPRNRWRALPHLPAAWADIRRGMEWIVAIRRAGVPIHRATALVAEGTGTLTGLSFDRNGERHTVPADLLLLHDGVIPSIQITRALGCAHAWNPRQRCWYPVTDAWGETTVPGIAAAGDGAGVAGAAAAIPSGEIAALGCAHTLGFLDTAARDAAAAQSRARHAKALASRPFIETLFPPLPCDPADDVLVCRCEEVPARDIRAAIEQGCQGLNQLKAFTRCGMGPCQGRMCGPTAAAIFARQTGQHPGEIEPFRTRFPAKPLTVGELAALHTIA